MKLISVAICEYHKILQLTIATAKKPVCGNLCEPSVLSISVKDQ